MTVIRTWSVHVILIILVITKCNALLAELVISEI
jgi:hypothetical protein